VVGRLALDGVPAAGLDRRWGVPRCELHRTLGSTLDAIHERGGAGAPPGTTVIALEQTAGRGRDGRTWHSPMGGVWLGMLLRPAVAELGVSSIRAGLALAEAVDSMLGERATSLKWPNDVLLGERKLAGILCEGRWHGERLQWLAVGVGVNVANAIPAHLAPGAVALRERLPAVRRIDLLDRLVPALARGAGRGPSLSDAECAAFATRDWLRGRELRAPAVGRASGVRPDGALLVDRGVESIVVREGHVELA
jgi:BirA family transcriptional regulator, biotin operon repressor / biotin---[acetyl-CoA-carboxylase] ligase